MGVPSRVEEWEFAPDPASARDVRRLVIRALDEKFGEVAASAALVVSELATNAVLHARTTFLVRLCVEEEVLRIEVEDRADGRPVLRKLSNQSNSGRGLRLVEGLTRAWGISVPRSGKGKIVWAELVLDGQAGHRTGS